MLSKLAVAFVAALAATAQAGHAKHHHFVKRHYSDNSTSVAEPAASTVTLVPIPSSSSLVGTGVSTVTLIPTPSGSVALSTGPSASIAHSSPVPLSTGPSATLVHSSSVPLSTGPSASLIQTSSVPLSTGPSASLVQTSSVPLGTGPSASLRPSSSVPLGTGPTSATQNPTTLRPHGSVVTQRPSTVSIFTSDSVLTYTIGTGSSTTIIVTTVRHTSTQTVYQTIYATTSSSGDLTATPEATNGVSDSTGATTTKRSYITSTAVITVIPVVASNSPHGSTESNTKVGNNNVHVACPAQVTVTVPGPKVTVTVTATAPAKSPSGASENAAHASEISSSPHSVGAKENFVEASPTSLLNTALPSLHSTALFHNGTEAGTSKIQTKTKYTSTGFLTRTSAHFSHKPSATGIFPSGTGVAYRY